MHIIPTGFVKVTYVRIVNKEHKQLYRLGN